MGFEEVLDFLDGPGFYILIAAAFGIIFLVSMVVMNKKKKEILALIESAEAMTASRDNSGALDAYKKVLNHLWGINGHTELTVEGIIMMMDDYGWSMLQKMQGLYTDPASSFKIDEIKEVIEDLKAMKGDKKLLDKDGLPKGEGKTIFKNIIAKLTDIHAKIPAVS